MSADELPRCDFHTAEEYKQALRRAGFVGLTVALMCLAGFAFGVQADFPHRVMSALGVGTIFGGAAMAVVCLVELVLIKHDEGGAP